MNTTLKTLLTLAGLTLATASAIAQTTPLPQGRAVERFQSADSNKDGSLSKDEATAGMPRLAQRFDAIDSNKDGKLTADEFQAQRGSMRGNARGTGFGKGAGPQAPQSGPRQGMGRGGRMGGRSAGMQDAGFRGQGGMLRNADADKDGVVTRAEAEKHAAANALSRFDARDANKDGKLTGDELTRRLGQRR